MRMLIFVVLPLLVQLAIASIFMFARHGGGEFVGLGVMLMGLFAVPVTALVNLMHVRRAPPLIVLINRTIVTTLVFPLLCLGLFLLAS